MSHEIFMEKGRASMMYTGETPWHGLGQRLDRPATAAETIREGNLDWKVTKLPLFGTKGILGVQVKGKYSVVREDQIGEPDAAALSIVSEGYTVLQNEDAFSRSSSVAIPGVLGCLHCAKLDTPTPVSTSARICSGFI